VCLWAWACVCVCACLRVCTCAPDVPDAPDLAVTRRVKRREVLARAMVEWRCFWMPDGSTYEVRRREKGAQDWTTDRCVRVCVCVCVG
jgi:hypothetical protein